MQVSSYALQSYERRVMPHEHNGSTYFIVSNICGIELRYKYLELFKDFLFYIIYIYRATYRTQLAQKISKYSFSLIIESAAAVAFQILQLS